MSRSGSTSQAATVDGLMSGAANLEMIGRLYHLPRKVARARGAELLAELGLEDAGDRLVKDYSGGMRRRLDLAASLVASPPVLFLDEPTTGLDPESRNELWDLLRAAGRRRHDADPHHPVPGGGRPARRRDRRCSTTARSSPPARRVS